MGLVSDIRSGWSSQSRVRLVWGRSRWSWAQLLARARKAAGLLTAHGLSPGDVVALQAHRGPDFLAVFLGALGTGRTVLLLNDKYTSRELGFLLNDARARLAILATPVDGGPPALSADALGRALDEATPEPIDGDASWRISADAVAALAYTSGTTGRPKGAVIRHQNILGTVHALHGAWGWTDADVLIHTLPLFHIHGLFVALLGALRADARVVLLPGFDADVVLATIQDEQGTVFMGVPTFYHRLLAVSSPPALPSMRLWTSGSAPLPAAVWTAFREAYGGAAILERYGMTETGIVLSNPLDGARVPGTVGFPLPGVRAQVTDPETGANVPTDTVGELRISGPGLITHYLGLPEKTAESIVTDEGGTRWMRTGDLAFQDPHGRFTLVGRIGDMVITGGLNVYPVEVETVLLEHPSVADVAVVGVPDDDWGERVVALVVRRPGHSVTADALLQFSRTGLAPYKAPKELRFADALPTNAMGKVEKKAIRTKWPMGDA